jgi:hypothetical protein
MKAQLADQKHQRELMANQEANQADAQRAMALEQHKQEMQAQQIQHQNEVEAQREMQRQQLEAAQADRDAAYKAQTEASRLEFDRWKAQLDAETRVLVAQIAAQSKEAETPAETLVKGGIEEPNTNAALAAAMQGFTQALAEMRAPRTIVRGPDGRAQGIV